MTLGGAHGLTCAGDGWCNVAAPVALDAGRGIGKRGAIGTNDGNCLTTAAPGVMMANGGGGAGTLVVGGRGSTTVPTVGRDKT